MSNKGKALGSAPSSDVSEGRRMEEQTREVEEFYRNMVELSPDGIFTIDARGVLLSCNTAVVKMFGFSKEEVVGKHLSKLGTIRLKDVPRYIKLLISVISGKVTEPVELTLQRKDGALRLADVHFNLLKIGGKTIVLATLRDVTESRQMEQELRLFSNAVAGAIDAIALTDMKGIITYVNPAMAEAYGYKEGEMLGKSVISLTPNPETASQMTSALIKTGSWHGELESTRRNKKTFLAQLSLSTVRDEKGNPMAMMGAMRDITERKRMEQKLRDKNEQLEAMNEELRAANEELRAAEEELLSAKEELEDRVRERTADLAAANEELQETQEQLVRSEKLAAIGQLAGGVGHELRNPLGAIKNAVYYIRGKVANSGLGQKEPRVMEFLDIVDDEVSSSNKIINDLLGFSRVGNPAVSPARIKKVIDDALSRLAIPENIEVVEKLDAGLPEINVDTDQIRQVLMNIIVNAVQAMPEGGGLTISAREGGKFLEVGVSDTGCGITEEVIGKIFDPLFTTRAKGIGLGLAVCKAIIERHGGDIEVESEVGKGASFTIRLPLKAE